MNPYKDEANDLKDLERSIEGARLVLINQYCDEGKSYSLLTRLQVDLEIDDGFERNLLEWLNEWEGLYRANSS